MIVIRYLDENTYYVYNVKEIEAEAIPVPPPTHRHEAEENCLIEILEDNIIVYRGSNHRLDSAVSTQQLPLTNRLIPQLNIRLKWNRSGSIEISIKVSSFIVETLINKFYTLP
ncbi:hypothetical protein L873DRAFT_1796199 [Choiromyces venosus 120613-1]|uniref:Uncharacterized protein n=1 Tax=Choiromyces venosus 120613-1 TaxID=1336337 RepID=A0A3N4ITK7_9PEZI|nr:hypothetical protein L873DRAFT_1796199 [Choiromyces venosus 120613-1]